MDTQTLIQLKPPKTFEEQLGILQERGLVVRDRLKAIKTLERLNYYRFTAYALTFKSFEKFHTGTTFENLYRHYEFDMKLRILLLEIIEPIEIAFRTHIAYLIAHKYGPTGYRDSKNFADQYKHSDFLQKLEQCLTNSKDPFVEHHRTKYRGNFPSWVAFEVLTFGLLSKLFSNLRTTDKKEIAKTYYPGVHYSELASWLRVLTTVRNKCAHYSRLFNQNLTDRAKIPKKYSHLCIASEKLFSVIIAIKHISTFNAWEQWYKKLESLIKTYPEIDIKVIGFIPQWKTALIK